MKSLRRALIGSVVVVTVVAVAAPAYAGNTWGGPQQVSPSTGHAIQLSDYGGVAAWIAGSTGAGPVRAARYRSGAKAWSKGAVIPGAPQVSGLQLSADGTYALLDVEATGYLFAQRSGSSWGTAQTLIAGTQVAGGQMSRDARVVVWVDWTGSQTTPVVIPGTVKSMVRADDGTWSAPVVVGTVLPGPASEFRTPVALSRNGSTVVWLDETSTIRSARLLSGVWQAPEAVATVNPLFGGLEHLAVERDGNDVVWIASGDDYLYMSEYISGWQAAQELSSAGPTTIVTAPNTRTIAFTDSDGYFQVLSRTSSGWATPVKRVIRGATRIAAANAAVATTEKRPGKSVLRVYTYNRGVWKAPVKLSTKATRPAVAADAKTVAWVSRGRIYTSKR